MTCSDAFNVAMDVLDVAAWIEAVLLKSPVDSGGLAITPTRGRDLK